MIRLRNSNLRKKRRRKLFLKSTLIIFTTFVIIAIPIILLNLNFWKINEVMIAGDTASAENIKEYVYSIISKRYLFLIPKSNILFVPQSKIEKGIIQNFPEITKAEIELKSLKSAQIKIEERKPASMWCSDKGECFLMDKGGFIFARAPNVTGNVYFIYEGAIEGNPLAQSYLPELFLRAQSFIKSVSEFGIKTQKLEYSEDKSFTLITESGTKIIFMLDGNEAQSISNLESILHDKELAVYADGILNAKSLDLRFGNKVIIKRGD